ncbi:MAG: hypothetical protein NZ898_07680, partial [Myxococcota bacterium]|nr:hypothetical protein [Myxococcota bacterium]
KALPPSGARAPDPGRGASEAQPAVSSTTSSAARTGQLYHLSALARRPPPRASGASLLREHGRDSVRDPSLSA